jgi:hypothetical protein
MKPEDIRKLRDAEPLAGKSGNGVYDQIVRMAPLHIVRVENLQAA